MLLAFVPMYLIAVAYRELNQAEPDCGTTFTWAARAFGPRTGWMGGWGIIAADIIVMANLAQIAGSYTFRLFGLDELADDQLWTTVAGVVWILLMTYICYRGIEVSARLQYALLGIEVVVLIAFAVDRAGEGVLRATRPRGRIVPSLDWLWPGGLSLLATSSTPSSRRVHLLGLGHRRRRSTRRPTTPPRTPGRAAVHLDRAAAGDLRRWSRSPRWPSPASAPRASAWATRTTPTTCSPRSARRCSATAGSARFFASLLIISVLTSAAASTQTTILPTARAALSMGAYRAIPPRFAKIHPRYLTPTWSTWGWASRLDRLLRAADGDQHERAGRLDLRRRAAHRLLLRPDRLRVRLVLPQAPARAGDLWMQGVLPALGGLMLLGAFIEACDHLRRPRLRLDHASSASAACS